MLAAACSYMPTCPGIALASRRWLSGTKKPAVLLRAGAAPAGCAHAAGGLCDTHAAAAAAPPAATATGSACACAGRTAAAPAAG